MKRMPLPILILHPDTSRSYSVPDIAQTLSVVLPVHNAERHLAERVNDLLDVLPDLAPQFEVLIVDDGSTDHTPEVADDLARRYPQVRVARHQQRRGLEASAKTGVSHTTGEMVIVHAGSQPVNATQFEKMWRRRNDEELVLARAGNPASVLNPAVLQHLVAWGQDLRRDPGDQSQEGRLHVIRRGSDSGRDVQRVQEVLRAPKSPFRLLPRPSPASSEKNQLD